MSGRIQVVAKVPFKEFYRKAIKYRNAKYYGKPFKFRGYIVKDMRSKKYNYLFEKGFYCHNCDMKAEEVFISKSNRDRCFVRFYGYDGKKPVHLTRDHIVPVSKGGSDHLSNLQPLCATCNALKADKMPNKKLSFPKIKKRKYKKTSILCHIFKNYYYANRRRKMLYRWKFFFYSLI